MGNSSVGFGTCIEGSVRAPILLVALMVSSDVNPCVPIVTLAVDNSPARLRLLCNPSNEFLARLASPSTRHANRERPQWSTLCEVFLNEYNLVYVLMSLRVRTSVPDGWL